MFLGVFPSFSGDFKCEGFDFQEELLVAGALQAAVEVYDTWRHEELLLELRMQAGSSLTG